MPSNETPVLIGCDHAALSLKNSIIQYLSEKNIAHEDVGTFTADSVDYVDYARKVAGPISEGTHTRGILLCGTGLGMSMAANRYPGVRAALCNGLFAARMSRAHNDANVLVLGGRVTGDILAREIVSTFFETLFEGDRHQRRIDKLDQLKKP